MNYGKALKHKMDGMDDMQYLKPENYRGSLCVKEDDGAWYMAVGCDLDDPDSWGWIEITEDLYKLAIEELS